MARMLIKYTMQEENSAGVEKTKEGGLYLPFSFAQSPDQISDKIGDTLFDIISKNKKEYAMNFDSIDKKLRSKIA